MGPILVFGHKNPDNDSVSSAVAYAHLKNLTDTENVYVPACLGPIPRETAWVFARFGVALPEEISHVRTRVLDVMTPDPVTITAEEPMLVAARCRGGVRRPCGDDRRRRACGRCGTVDARRAHQAR